MLIFTIVMGLLAAIAIIIAVAVDRNKLFDIEKRNEIIKGCYIFSCLVGISALLSCAFVPYYAILFIFVPVSALVFKYVIEVELEINNYWC
ncbi:hypothetical protein MOA67_gp263 [Klebsiella phage KpLz-2_45]|uniref:hypothetical protein n=1 Tax=Klebsiella phage KpLz-2_45 TaxID=2698923 RepID=UPI001F12D4B9|nr:hypothetical protein MOA67_gp263 [Klebsiella phage KpLz-2_45]UKS72160.1 hypothetical protein KpLz245_2940 [Klebsiella phage KpLz-2_45]